MPHVYVWKKLWDTNIHLTEVQNVKWAKVKGSMAVSVYNQCQRLMKTILPMENNKKI